MAAWIDGLAADAGAQPIDSQAPALAMVEAPPRSGPGRVPSDVDGERFIATWVEAALSYTAARGISASRASAIKG